MKNFKTVAQTALAALALLATAAYTTTPAAAAEPTTAETHFHIKTPLYASAVQGLNLPGAAAARDVLMVNVRLLAKTPFRLRVFYTVRLPDGKEATYERDVRVRPNDLWASVAFDEEGILDHAFLRIRIREEPEPEPLVETTTGVSDGR